MIEAPPAPPLAATNPNENAPREYSRAAAEAPRRNYLWIVLLLGGLVMALPFVWLLATSFRTYRDVLTEPMAFWPKSFTLQNWQEAFSTFPFWLYFRNTLLITLLNIAGILVSSSLVAYGLTRFQMRWAKPLLALILATMMVPGQITSIALYIWYVKLNWIDTFLPLWVPAFFGSAFGIFLLCQFFRTLPSELTDAAVIDGAGEMTILTRIYLPLSRPALAALAVLTFLGVWNDLYAPSLYLQSRDNFTLSQGLQYLIGTSAAGSGQNATYGALWNLLSAAALLTCLPILAIFFAAQRYFIEGITMTGLKD